MLSAFDGRQEIRRVGARIMEELRPATSSLIAIRNVAFKG